MSDNLESIHVTPVDRQFQTEPNTDPTGKDWVIFRQRGTSLFFVRPDPDRSDAVIPELITGRFTKVELAQKAIDRFLEMSWASAAKTRAKNTRTSEATSEQKIRDIQAAVDAENDQITAAKVSKEKV